MCIDIFQRERFDGRTSGVVIENRAVGRILSPRYTRRQWSVRIAVPAKTNRLLRFVQSDRSIRQLRAQLSQRRNVVQNPNAEPLPPSDQITATNPTLAHPG